MPSRVSQNPRLFLQDLPGKGLQGALVCTHHAHAERGLPREAEQPGKKQGSCGHPDPLALLGLADIPHLPPTRSWAAIHQAHLEQIFRGPMALLRGSARCQELLAVSAAQREDDTEQGDVKPHDSCYQKPCAMPTAQSHGPFSSDPESPGWGAQGHKAASAAPAQLQPLHAASRASHWLLGH